MAITSVPNFKTALLNAFVSPWAKGDLPNPGQQDLLSTMKIGGFPVVFITPSTAVAPTSATTGAMPLPQGALNNLRILAADWAFATFRPTGTLILCDRLSHQGGLVADSVSVQTTNLPTAALTRSTDGAGVLVAVEVYTATGTASTTLTCSYTNQAGTVGRTSKASRFGTNYYSGVNNFRILSLADSDTGVRSVQSLTLAATTGSAGSIGITLFKPLMVLSTDNLRYQKNSANNLISGGLQLEVIPTNACLFVLALGGFGGATLQLRLAED